jgi:signal transduction histidine kinase
MVEWLLHKRWRIIVTGVLIAIIPLVSVTLFVYLGCGKYLVAQSNETRRAIVASVAQELADHLEMQIVLGSAYVARPLLAEAVAREERTEISRHLRNLIETSGTIARAFVTSPQGVVLCDYPEDAEATGEDLSTLDWYQGVSRTWTPYVSRFYQQQASPRRYLFAIAIPIKEAGRVVGILVMQPQEDFIRGAVNDLKVTSGTTYVVDSQGLVIYHSAHGDNGSMANFSGVPVVVKVLRGRGGVEETRDAESGAVITAVYHPLAGYGWGVVNERSRQEVLAPMAALGRGLILFSGVMVLMTMLIAYRWADMFSASRALSIRLQREESFDKAHAALLLLFNRQMDDLTELGRVVLVKLAEVTRTDAALLHVCQEGELLPGAVLARPLPAEADELAKEALSQGREIRVDRLGPANRLRVATGVGEFLPREIVAVPLFCKGEAMGVLELASLQGFSEDDHRLVERIAPQIAIAIASINNSLLRGRLIERLAHTNEELAAMNDEVLAMNEELQAQQQELAESNQRLAAVSRAKSDFLANMNHELRAPLSSVIGFSEVLRDQLVGPLNDKQTEYVAHILNGGHHLLSLINDILDLAKVESGKMDLDLDRFPLKELVEGALVIVREKAMVHHLRISLDLALEQEREIVADKRKLKQILYNLLSNAVKFTPDGGEIRVAARQLMTPGEEGEWVEIRVTDTGIGIREEDKERLFKPFSQLAARKSEEYAGTGLGLALTKQLVALHGGTIRVETSPGQGSSFIFTLPLTQPPPAEQPPSAPDPLAYRGGTHHGPTAKNSLRGRRGAQSGAAGGAPAPPRLPDRSCPQRA